MTEHKGILIAIDGPSGSGKSTVAKAIAVRLGITYLDTGAMYRALTWFCLEQGIDLDKTELVRQQADSLDFSMTHDPHSPRFFAGDIDITAEIRTPRVAERVAEVARNLSVRSWMATEQRRVMTQARESGHGMIAEGRDITTVVCPDADVRVLLLADEKERLRRRTYELYGSDAPQYLKATAKQIGERDRSDATVSDFFEAAEGVSVIDSTGKSIEDVVDEIVAMTRSL
ncbi:(d)CMP kinase [Scrofimicrobium canadense]|uniref:(d)CMP kinase n=1 Tax=Scrofimicrobium canadense TaxID=2652290 RepID=UPI00298E6166|nr:(d)CMP kinase [Scrofimicrobium canadense]